MYKSILVHIDGSAQCSQRIDVAAQLAATFDSHLIGVAVSGLSEFMTLATAVEGAPTILFPLEALCAEAELDLDAFEAALRQRGLPSYERRRIDDEAGQAIALQARYSDLLIVSQMPAARPPRLPADFLPYVLLHAVRPVLVLPAAWQPQAIGRRITVAWNGSEQALRAIASAIPLLQRAEQVALLVMDAAGAEGHQAGADMGRYLARHGIAVALHTWPAGAQAGEALLTFAQDTGSDLLVMGAYGHSRLREHVLGGASATVLHSAPLPVWMAH